MHAPMAYVNGTGKAHQRNGNESGLELLNTLLASATGKSPADQGDSTDEAQAEKERRSKSSTQPPSFKNDPDDPTNPNEERKRFLKKVNRQHNR